MSITFVLPVFDLEYDGFTVPIQASSGLLSAGSHHLKIIIADAGDEAVDSAVLLRCDSFGVPDGIKGDVNCDGVVDLLDVGPFVDVITGGGPYNVKADVNCDGVNDLLDVQPFVALLV